MAILDDYLEVRPEARPRVARLVEAGRLGIGPWYVLADELLAGDEPLVRNLLAGRRGAAALGGWLPVGYSPDAFGHPATLPSVLRGFGIGTALLWRGHGGHPGQDRDLFRWRAPDGAEILVHHLPPAGYEYGANLPSDPGEAGRRWAALRAVLDRRAAVPVRLVLNGADHHALQPDLGAAVAALRRVATDCRVEIGTLAQYFDAVAEPAAAARLLTAEGELRRSYRAAWTLQGVHATRAGLKRRIAEGAALLTRWAEPQAALAAAAGGADRRPLLEAAWREHLRNLSHDVLAGCVADPVADDASARARRVTEQARGILDDALLERLGLDPAAARGRSDRWSPCLVVVNPSPAPRGRVVEATVFLPRERIVVGRPTPVRPARVAGPPPAFRLMGPDGRAVPVQILDGYPAYDRLESPRDYPDQAAGWAVRVAAWVAQVPAFGCMPLSVVRGRRARGGGRAPAAAPAPRDPAAEALRLELVSERDEGDTYTFEPVSGDRPILARWGDARAVWDGRLVRATARTFRVGDRAEGTLYVRTDAGSPLIRYVVEGVNRRGHHRLRVVFPAGRARDVTVDVAYGPVTRAPVSFDPADFPREWPATTGPMHRYVSVGGRTVFARGLHEHEVLADGSLAVTLVRAVGDLSRGHLRARPGHAGWPTATPGAREIGGFRAELAVLPAGVREGDAAEAWDAVEQAAEAFHAPLGGRMLRWAVAPPHTVAGPELIGRGLAFKALKPREDADGVVLRCVNLTGRTVTAAWRWPGPVSRAFRARLDETVLAEVRLEGDRREIPFRAGAREIVTIVVEP